MYEKFEILNLDNMQIVISDKKYTILTIVRNFSNESVHRPCQISRESIYIKIIKNQHNDIYKYPFKIYTNGKSESDKGCISIVFQGENIAAHTVESQVTVSIIDYEKHTCRFSETYSFSSYRNLEPNLHENTGVRFVTDAHIPQEYIYENSWPRMVINEYMNRKVLINEAAVFLPQDILTLQLNLHIREYRPFQNSLASIRLLYQKELFTVRENFKELNEDSENEKLCLPFDSPFGGVLSKNSIYFEKIKCSPMPEKELGYLPLSDEQADFLMRIGCILNEALFIIFQSIDQIIDLYAWADYYDCPIVMEASRDFLKECLTSSNVSKISNLARQYSDDKLVKFIKEFQQNIENSSKKGFLEPYLIFKLQGLNLMSSEVENRAYYNEICNSKDFFDLDIFK